MGVTRQTQSFPKSYMPAGFIALILILLQAVRERVGP